ncbi:hypothetical protein ASH00_15850 [Arthrobacter sp. Soil782]|nr:hypothetical protein ASH00_15850 [Arthrobacter sp. Soil782]
MLASWCELFRHFMEGASVDPLEVRRRAGRARMSGLKVVDLCDPAIQAALGVIADELTGDDYDVCQDIADAARGAGLDGVMAPSAGLPGYRTLAIFPSAINRGLVAEERSRVQVPPINLVDVLEQVRATPSGRAGFAKYRRRLRRMGRATLRRRYRRR